MAHRSHHDDEHTLLDLSFVSRVNPHLTAGVENRLGRSWNK